MSNEIIHTTQTYLTFQLNKEFFAANVNNVLNILGMMPITQIPKAPYYIKGVINMRGTALPVIDTRLKFGMPTVEASVNTAILVLNVQIEGKDVMLGAVVDSVDEVIELDGKHIQESPTLGAKYKSEFIVGMAQKEEGFIMLLDMDKVFSSDELLVVNQIAENDDINNKL
ncbi:MAG: chemotaxis protein CheW [Salinivirgaceae bacterium]|nr:chemotaxis protein CheW [Salinivirgaceae bacterium]